MFIEENCDHSVVAFNLCAICGLDMKRYYCSTIHYISCVFLCVFVNVLVIVHLEVGLEYHES